jgi:hypothetical protein
MKTSLTVVLVHLVGAAGGRDGCGLGDEAGGRQQQQQQ